jgi:hypothetical protein
MWSGLVGEAANPASCWSSCLGEAVVILDAERGFRRDVDVVASGGVEAPGWTARKTTSSDP